MVLRKIHTAFTLVCAFVLTASCLAASQPLVEQERIIAGSPADSMEVRHLILKGTNEAIGRRLAEIARDRYQAKLTPGTDPVRTRAQRLYIEKNYPILYERMRGLASLFGHSIDDDHWDFSAVGFTELHAACSIAQIPPNLTATGTSVVSRDYDYSTGGLTFGFLQPGMLHPTARPYLIELHPDHGYASVAMVAYDLLSGVLDGMNSEGLTVTMAMDDEAFEKHPIEPVGGSAAGLGELQTLRLLLDTCGTVDEAKQALLQTKQYYGFIPVHYLIADRYGKSFVWEYSYAHNKEYIIENPGKPLVMTNFSINQHLNDNKPPSADEARKECKRYALLTENLNTSSGLLSEELISQTHQRVDAVWSQAADPSRPPIRTFWHALYYPEERRVKYSFYLHDEPTAKDANTVRVVRTPYIEFRLDATEGGRASTAVVPRRAAAPAVAQPMPAVETKPEIKSSDDPTGVIARLKSGGATVIVENGQVVRLGLETKVGDLSALLPLLRDLPELTLLNIQNETMNDASMAQLKGLSKLATLGLSSAAIGDEGLKVLKTLPALRTLTLGGTSATDAGLATVASLTQLESLGLRGTRITDAGLAQLKTLTNLTSLGLTATNVTDAGLAQLENMTNLTELGLAETKVTDAGLSHLTRMTKLQVLNLRGDAITDAGLAQIGNLKTVAGLNLSGTSVTDAGLAGLKPLSRLTKLNLTKTAVTDEGAAQAKKFLPFWATITRDKP
jgi:penicillin V acylase-like amidase (Ntn superfamily)